MANILNTIYPPLVDTFLPAFPSNQNPKFTFSISPYNEPTQIKKIHVSLVKQKTNLNALKTNNNGWEFLNNSTTIRNNLNGTSIQQGIWIIPIKNSYWFKYDLKLGLFSLEIPEEILKNQSWEVNEFYKIQLRFDTSDVPITENYLLNNLEYFSEWSRICLLKMIEPINIYIRNFDDLPEDEDNYWTNAGTLPITGYITFDKKRTSSSKEYLQSYQITIFETLHPTKILSQSDLIYTGNLANQNDINTLMDVSKGKQGIKYSVKINITTKNQYKYEKIYKNILAFLSYSEYEITPVWHYNNVILSDNNRFQSPPQMATEEDGIVDITFSATGTISSGYLYIRRSSDLDNFNKWDLIKCVYVPGSQENQTQIEVNIKDYTVSSLVLYQYSAQFENIKGNLGKTYISDYVYPKFHDILLYRDGRQLAVRLNGTIQSPKINVNRQKIDTLGGKYPKFTENAQMNYKSFNISGYIDAESDYNRQFFNDLEYTYGLYPVSRIDGTDINYTLDENPQKFGQMNTYNYYMDGKYEIRNDVYPNTTKFPDIAIKDESIENNLKLNELNSFHHNTYPKDNWWLQRKFREEAIAWLNDGEPKLFRTMTEGNLVVMLTDINLTPVQSLGRRIYQFNCMAYEVADGYDLNTLHSLGIFKVINDKEENENEIIATEYEITGLGQYNSLDFSKFDNFDFAHIFKGTMIENYSGLNEYNYETLEEKIKNRIYESYYTTEDNNNIIGHRYNYISDSLKLKNIKIYFESKPQYYILDDVLTLVDQSEYLSHGLIYDEKVTSDSVTGIGLGYKIGLKISNLDDILIIFVNARGYYQIPSNLEVEDLILYDKVKASIEYQYSYKTIFNSDLLPESSRISKNIISQLSGMWTPNVYVNNLLQQKHSFVIYDEDGKMDILEKLINWKAVTLEMNPYSVVGISFLDTGWNDNYITVGRTGILNLSDNYNIADLHFFGKRMVRVPKERQPYLSEWEFVFDITAEVFLGNNPNLLEDSLVWKTTNIPVEIDPFTTQDGRDAYQINRYWNNYNLENDYIEGYPKNLFEIKNPKYNTVYAVKTSENEIKLYIYYIDDAWYEVNFWSEDNYDIILAKVPTHGILTYQAQIVRNKY